MPEGDSIERLARRISDRFGGRSVMQSVTRDPRLVGVDFAGSMLVEAVAVGKHLLIRFDDERTLHSHLKMDGRWEVGARSKAPEWKRRVELVFDDGRLTGVDVPILGVVDTAAEHTIVGHLGPDLCAPDPPDATAIAQRLASEGDRPLAGALLDQRVLAGFGNIFAVETPFLTGVSPTAPVGGIGHLDHLVRVGMALLRWSATGAVRNTTGRRLHRSDYHIYQSRSGRCPVCGASLRHLDGDASEWDRSTWWCPECQHDGPADIARARSLLKLHPARSAI